jgi:hypothetical protein
VPDSDPGSGQDDEQAAGSPDGQPGFAWAPGSTGTGPVPSPGLDWQALLDALAAGGLLDGDPDGQDGQDGQDAAGERSAAGDGRVGPALSPGRAGALAVEHMPAGPVQAGWLAAAAAEAGSLDEYGLAGVAIAARRLASWAQAAELAAVAQITARAAAADRRIGLAADGRPGRLCRDAVGQVSLALMLTDHAATGWADLAVTLAWRLPQTGQALAAGAVDLARARVIAEATAVLSQDAARAVEAEVLPGAGGQTTAQLRVRLRRAVIAADPGAAERRRQDAERQAKVSLYADEDGTATLTGSGLPAVEAAAAMARVTAIARAAKAAGQGGGLDLHRARVMVGLLLGTLPYIPPPGGAPEPDPPPGGDDSPAGRGPGPGGSSSCPGDCRGYPGGHDPGGNGPGGNGPGGSPETSGPGRRGFGGGPWDDPPAPRDEDAPEDDGLDQGAPEDDGRDDGEDDWPGTGPVPPWPGLGAIAPALARPQPADGRPAPGLLDLTLPWTTLTGHSAAPGLLGRIGPITATQARRLARAAQAAPPPSGASSLPTPPGKPSPSPASPAAATPASATIPGLSASALTGPAMARRPAPGWSAASP